MEGTSPVIKKSQNSRITGAPGRLLKNKLTHQFSNWVPHAVGCTIHKADADQTKTTLLFHVSYIEVPRTARFQTEGSLQSRKLSTTRLPPSSYRTRKGSSQNLALPCSYISSICDSQCLHFLDSPTRLSQCCPHSLLDLLVPGTKPATREELPKHLITKQNYE